MAPGAFGGRWGTCAVYCHYQHSEKEPAEYADIYIKPELVEE